MFMLVSFFVTMGMAAVFVSAIFAIVYGYKKLLQFEDLRQNVASTMPPAPQSYYQYTNPSSKEDNIKYQLYRVKKQIEIELRDKFGKSVHWEPASAIGFTEQVTTAIKSDKSCSVEINVYYEGREEPASVNFNIGKYAGIKLKKEQKTAYSLSDEISIDMSKSTIATPIKKAKEVSQEKNKDGKGGYVEIPIETLIENNNKAEKTTATDTDANTNASVEAETEEKVEAETEDMSEVELKSELPYTFNYEQIANGFLEDNFHEIVDSAVQEAMQANEKEFVLTPDELPQEMESWSAICKLLVTKRYGMKHAEIIEEGGILVQI